MAKEKLTNYSQHQSKKTDRETPLRNHPIMFEKSEEGSLESDQRYTGRNQYQKTTAKSRPRASVHSRVQTETAWNLQSSTVLDFSRTSVLPYFLQPYFRTTELTSNFVRVRQTVQSGRTYSRTRAFSLILDHLELWTGSDPPLFGLSPKFSRFFFDVASLS